MKGEGTGWFDKSDIMTDYFHTVGTMISTLESGTNLTN